jgi:FtsP/CotA-like multicopper oxidase with cupredoxin domain/glucose/arabinose dehydrogenase
MFLSTLTFFLFCCCCCVSLVAAQLALDVCVSRLLSSNELIDAHAAPGSTGVLYLLRKAGIVQRFDRRNATATAASTVIDFSTSVTNNGEMGALSLVFHPAFVSNRRFFVLYIEANSRLTVVAEFAMSANGNSATGPTTIFSAPYLGQGNHKGGTLLFSSVDRFLYITLGDGGCSNDCLNQGQNTQTLHGKILRIDVDRRDAGKLYAVPPSNPYVGNAAYAPEIFAMGMRNPFRVRFHPDGRRLYVGDVGQGAWEEVSVIDTAAVVQNKGINEGWPIFEGFQCNRPQATCNAQFSSLNPPIFQYRNAGGASVMGGEIVTGTADARLSNVYLFADFQRCVVFANNRMETTTSNCLVPNVLGLVPDASGRHTCPSPCPVNSTTATSADYSRFLRTIQLVSPAGSPSIRGQIWGFSKDERGELLIINPSGLWTIVSPAACNIVVPGPTPPPATPVPTPAPQPTAAPTRQPTPQPVPAPPGGSNVTIDAALFTVVSNAALDMGVYMSATTMGMGRSEYTFTGATGLYIVFLWIVAENDGQSPYEVFFNNVRIAQLTAALGDMGITPDPKYVQLVSASQLLTNGQKFFVDSAQAAGARGRWRGIIIRFLGSGPTPATTASTRTSTTTSTTTTTTTTNVGATVSPTTAAPTTTAPVVPVPEHEALKDIPTLCPEVVASGSSVATLRVTLTVGVATWATKAFSFNTRAYNGGVPAPTIAVTRGTKLLVKVVNTLGAETAASLEGGGGMDATNRFHRPNTTNLHVHGLHVSSTGRADNVSVMIEPGAEHEYEYDIDVDHPTGTFWYHPHFHGSTALQMDGGMAGAIVVLDDPAEIDANPPREHVLMLQLAGFGDTIKTGPVRLVAQLSESALPVQLVRPRVADAAPTVHMTVNGQLEPQLSVGLNEPRRLRIVNANGALFVRLSMRPLDAATPACTLTLLAMDGIYRSAPVLVTSVVIPPGGRACVVVQCAGAGVHELRSLALTNEDKTTLANAATFEGLLMRVSVSASAYAGAARIPTRLPPLPRYLADAAAAPAPASAQGFQFFSALMSINGERYKHHDGAAIATLSLGKPHDFAVSADDSENHPIHWHVNHVQIVAMTMPQSNETMHVGQWRDTVPASDAGTVTIRVVPHRFTGEMRGHCHLAVDGDLGMMTNANVDDAAGVAASHAPVAASADKARAALAFGLCSAQVGTLTATATGTGGSDGSGTSDTGATTEALVLTADSLRSAQLALAAAFVAAIAIVN